MIILEENFKWHLEAFASEIFIYSIGQVVFGYFTSKILYIVPLSAIHSIMTFLIQI